MKTSWLLGAALLLAGGVSLPAADTVELNGISCLPGEKLACLLLYQPSLTKPLNFLLAEGESQFGFKLIAVDAVGQRVLIEKCGVRKYVRIGSAPDLIAAPGTLAPAAATGRPSAADAQSVASYLASEEVKRIQAGNPIVSGATGFAIAGARKSSGGGQSAAPGAGNTGQNASAGSSNGGQSANDNPGNGGQNFNAGTSGGGTANSSAAPAGQNSHAGEVWYQESLSLEQSRVLTAAAVLAGELTPLPRTPLTPPGTPAQLVSQEVYFANYIPGFQVTGFLNGF